MKSSIRTLTLVIGTLAGAFIGYRAAMNFIEQSEAENRSTPTHPSARFAGWVDGIGCSETTD